jgi:hypothetical protein
MVHLADAGFLRLNPYLLARERPAEVGRLRGSGLSSSDSHLKGAVTIAKVNLFRAVTVVLTATLAAGLLVETKPAGAAFPGENGMITFAGDPYFVDGRDIYVINPDGSGQANLTDNSADDSDPANSPDGDKIAFTTDRNGNYEIYTLSATSSDHTRLTANPASDFQPAFSPDGSKIAFTSNRDGNDEIYVMNADGTGQTRLTDNAASDSGPAFSPNGSKIAFTSERDGNKEVYTMDPDGSTQTNLTHNSANDSQPSFSPDGAKVAFTSDRDGGNQELYAMNPDGSGQTNLTNNANTRAPSHDYDPAFSPDGQKIAYYSYEVCPPGFYCGAMVSGGMFVMNSDSSGVTQLTGPGNDYGLDWGTGSSYTTPPEADDDPPETNIVSGPLGPTNDNTPTFSFGGSDDVSLGSALLYSYKVDNGGWSAYSAQTSVTISSLSNGEHTFYVKAKDEAGNEDSSPAQQGFKVDTQAPQVAAVSPTVNATGIAGNTNVTATFSEDIDPNTVTVSTFKLSKQGTTTSLGAAVSYDPVTKKATLNPVVDLRSGTTYTAIVTTGVKDKAGNALTTQKVWSFTVRR